MQAKNLPFRFSKCKLNLLITMNDLTSHTGATHSTLPRSLSFCIIRDDAEGKNKIKNLGQIDLNFVNQK